MSEPIFAPVEPCPHGIPRDEYCVQCTYIPDAKGQLSPQDLVQHEITVTFTVEAEKHWGVDELRSSVVSYLTEYIDEPTGSYQPRETYYIRGCHASGN